MDTSTNENSLPKIDKSNSIDRPLGVRRASGFSMVETNVADKDRKVTDHSVEVFLSRILPKPLHQYIESIKYDPTQYGSGETKMGNGYGNISIHPPEPDSNTSLTAEDVYYLVAHEAGHVVSDRLRNYTAPDLWNRWRDAVYSNPKLLKYMQDTFPIGGYDQTVQTVHDQLEELFGQVLAASSEKTSQGIMGLTAPTEEAGVFGNDPEALNFSEQIKTQRKILEELAHRATLPNPLDEVTNS